MRRRLTSLTPKFVEYIPAHGEDLVPGVVYISMQHNTVVHRCPCGCGGLSEFVLDPIRFRIEYDGSGVTFNPSIGNSNLQCRSHYWIRGNKIYWCPPMEDRDTRQAQREELSRALEERETAKWGGRITIVKVWCSLAVWWKRWAPKILSVRSGNRRE